MKITVSSLALVGLTAFFATAAGAQAPGYTFDNTEAQYVVDGPPYFTLGSEFTANSGVTITQLGIFDDLQDGLVDSYPVGLFDSAGALLASATIPSGTGAPLINQFRYVAITPVTLQAGMTYEVGALYLSDHDALFFPDTVTDDPVTNFATDPRITFNRAMFNTGITLAAPLDSGNLSGGYFGPNFLIQAADIPEPSAVMFGVVAALSVLGVIVRKRKSW